MTFKPIRRAGEFEQLKGIVDKMVTERGIRKINLND